MANNTGGAGDRLPIDSLIHHHHFEGNDSEQLKSLNSIATIITNFPSSFPVDITST